ncbi:hypothetical protein L2E82_13769 [Cichorium intybus]|uniref:Uncharacterized protein n=1 Tax=Cichorium intybus TaxID=13427 RepID=A0ACB9EY40_CICIN|nr:hypothetical protein L2E82_13769 [Cichorium intybus]
MHRSNFTPKSRLNWQYRKEQEERYAVEKVLAGAIRKEMTLEEFCTIQNIEIMQLNRLEFVNEELTSLVNEHECDAGKHGVFEFRFVLLIAAFVFGFTFDGNTERHINVSLEMLLKLVAVFGPVITSTVSAPPTVGVDHHAEKW